MKGIRTWTGRGIRGALIAGAMVMTVALPAQGQGGPAALPLDKTAGAEASDAEMKRAEELFKKGAEHYKAQRWPEAEKAYREAWSIRKTYDIATNLGQVLYKQNKVREAALYFSFALKNWPLSGKAELRELARQRFLEVRGKVGAVAVKGSPRGAEIVVNGEVVGVPPFDDEVFVEPGEVVIEAKLADYEPWKKSVTVAAGGAETVTVEMVKVKPKQDEGPVAVGPVEVGKRSMVPVYALGSASLVMLGVGFGLDLYGKDQAEKTRDLIQQIKNANGKCGSSPRHSLCDEYESTRSSGQAVAYTAVGFYIAGVLAAGGALAWALWPVGGAEKKKEETKQGLQVTPLLSGTSFGLAAQGRF